MPIYKGNTKIVKLYKGTTQIVKRYKGTNIIYSASRLPAEFQEVEYLESSGTQWIDTGYVPTTTNITVELDYQTTNIGNLNQYIVSCHGNNCDFLIMSSSLSAYGYVINAGHYTSGITPTNRHLLRSVFTNQNTQYLYVDNVQKVNSNEQAITLTQKISILARVDMHGNVSRYCIGKIYSCQIYDNDIIVRNFVPCYRKADNVAGLYDLVNGVFYTNAGTGTFIVGGNV